RRGRYTVSRFPVAVRPSGFASWVILRPLRSCAFLTVGPPAIITPDPNGVVMLRMNKIRPGRAPPLPRGRGCAPGRRLSSGRHPPLPSGQSLRPRCHIPSAGVTFTRRHRGFTRVRPSPRDGWRPPWSRKAKPLPPVFSSPATTGWNESRFGFDPGLRTPRLPAEHAGAETGHRALARVLHLRHQ